MFAGVPLNAAAGSLISSGTRLSESAARDVKVEVPRIKLAKRFAAPEMGAQDLIDLIFGFFK